MPVARAELRGKHQLAAVAARDGFFDDPFAFRCIVRGGVDVVDPAVEHGVQKAHRISVLVQPC